MKRFALTLAGLLALPVLAEAQTAPVYTPEPHPQQLPHSRFAITPFVATRIPFSTGGYYLTGENGVQILVEEERQAAAAAGLNLDVLLRGPFAFTAGVAFSDGPRNRLAYGAPSDSLPEDRKLVDAPSMWFAKAGITARIPDPIRDDRRFHPSGFVTVAPAMVFLGSTPGQEATQHFALNLGADATARIGQSNFAIQLGLEDYITFWNTDDFAAHDAGRFAADPRFEGGAVFIDYNYDIGSILLARLGVSYRPGRRVAMAAGSYTAPPPPVAMGPAASSAAPSAIRYCVVRDGQLAEVEATYDAARADTMIGGQPVAMAYPADALPYAAGTAWFINHEPLAMGNSRYIKYGLPRRLSPRDLRPAGEYRGVPLFTDASMPGNTDIYYVPVRSGCEFQPYQNTTQMGSVRG